MEENIAWEAHIDWARGVARAVHRGLPAVFDLADSSKLPWLLAGALQGAGSQAAALPSGPTPTAV